MSDGLIVQVDLRAASTVLGDALGRVENTGAMMPLIGAALERNINARFISKTDPDGHAWLPLSPATVKRKKGLGSILEFSGLMKQMQVNAGDTYVEIGSAEIYAQWHETGTRYMPRRQFLSSDFVAGTLGKGDLADIEGVVMAYLEGAGL